MSFFVCENREKLISNYHIIVCKQKNDVMFKYFKIMYLLNLSKLSHETSLCRCGKSPLQSNHISHSRGQSLHCGVGDSGATYCCLLLFLLITNGVAIDKLTSLKVCVNGLR